MDLLDVVVPEAEKEVKHIGDIQKKIPFDIYRETNKFRDTLTENFKKIFSI